MYAEAQASVYHQIIMSYLNARIRCPLPLLLGWTLLLTSCADPSGSEPAPNPETEQHEQPAAPLPQTDAAAFPSPPDNPRTALSEALQAGLLAEPASPKDQFKAVLHAAAVSEASQVLVFSKTSFQLRLISPSNPRAIYFNDDCYIATVPGGLVEYGDADPDPQIVSGLFALDLNDGAAAALKTNGECLSCHSGSRTGGQPGFFIRSVFPDPEGHVITSAGSTDVSHDTPLQKRWGGWYVTGTSGSAHHRGNQVTIEQPNGDAYINNALGSNITDLSPYFDTDRYLRPTSDIVALMVLEHQVQMHNLLTQGAASVRLQTERSRSLAEYLHEEFDPAKSDTLQRVIASNADRVVKHMLFCDEIRLDAPVIGNDDFQIAFRANRREDNAGRSLKDFDLQTHMFRYRCSYMIYSRAFTLMPDLLKDAVIEKLYAVLRGEDSDPSYAHLPMQERASILNILRQTTGYFADQQTKAP